MSPIARRVLKNRLRFVNRGLRITNVGGRSIFSPYVCPSKKASDDFFWDYIRQRLEGGRRRMNVSNRNVILSSGIRKIGTPSPLNRTVRNTVRGGNFTDMYNLYKKLFPGDYKVSFIGAGTPMFVFKHGKRFERVVIHHGVEYILSHAYITMTGSKSVHIIAGFIDSRGKSKIYDSASDKFYTFDWDVPFTQFGKYTSGIHKVAVYVMRDL
jgi:hypothetical protein